MHPLGSLSFQTKQIVICKLCDERVGTKYGNATNLFKLAIQQNTLLRHRLLKEPDRNLYIVLEVQNGSWISLVRRFWVKVIQI